MDSHYHQVMKAREGVDGKGTKLYFAYSTILDRAAFEEWRTQHSYEFFDLPQGKVVEAHDVDLVFDFPSRWWGGLVAGLTDKKGAKVFGMLFEIPEKEWPIVQHKEGFITGMCVERKVKVLVDGKEVEAIAFTTDPVRATKQGEISPKFIDALVKGAQQAKLPQAYIEHLKGIL
jgi:hypothetical protein